MTSRTGTVERRGGALVLTAPADMPVPTMRSLQQRLLMFLDAELEERVTQVAVDRAAELRDLLGQWPAVEWEWSWTPEASRAAARAQQVGEAMTAVIRGEVDIDSDGLSAELRAAGFDRALLPAQVEAVAQLAAAGSGGNFSVPGSGKTTMTYALYALLRGRGLVDRLLVVAPQSAYEAWELEAEECFRQVPIIETAPRSPRLHSEVVVYNYERAASGAVRATIDRWANGHRLLVVFDEAHRAKRGVDGYHGRGAYDLASIAEARIVLTGTPMPNGASDLEAILDLAWPGHGARLASGTLPNSHRTWVRITKDDLGLEPADVTVEQITLDPAHQQIYDAVATGALRELGGDRAQQRAAIVRLIAAATNPLLILPGEDSRLLWPRVPEVADDLEQLVRGAQGAVLPAKLLAVARHVETHANAGTKLVVWTNFLGNVKELGRLLSPYSPAVVTGSTPRVDPSAPTDRERELRRFRTDPACAVLVATPQTLGEGVSLHRVSQSQVHLDRLFNAGLYLQALDRTHRVGMPEGTSAEVTLLVARRTIDEHVDASLRRKLNQMEAALRDPTLGRLAGLGNERDFDITDEELEQLVAHLR